MGSEAEVAEARESRHKGLERPGVKAIKFCSLARLETLKTPPSNRTHCHCQMSLSGHAISPHVESRESWKLRHNQIHIWGEREQIVPVARIRPDSSNNKQGEALPGTKGSILHYDRGSIWTKELKDVGE